MDKLNRNYQDKQEFLEKLNETYDQIEEINSGGGGIIYKGIHRRLKKKVVLKKIRSDRLSIIGSEREMKILMSLKHTYLPGILDFWSYEDEVYTVMEFIEGRSFQELLQEGRKFSEKEVIKWTRQLAEVLEYLHNSPEHIIHSDIKPANLMLTTTNDICLIDFNVSILQDGEDETIGYSASYSPVEQLIQKELVSQKRREKKQAEYQEEQPVVYQQRTEKPIYSDRTEIADDRTQIDDDQTEVDDDRTQIDDDRTEIDDDRTRIDDDRTQIDDRTEIAEETTKSLQKEVTRKEKVTQTVQKAADNQPVYQKPALEVLVKQYGKKLKVDERSDIYSACATMYHILTGARPAPCYAPQKPVEEVLPSVNDAFAYILMHGMEQHPKNRYQNATQLLTAMRQLMKSTRRYKRMLHRQDLIIVILVGMFLASASAAYFGWGMRLSEGLTSKINEAYLSFEQGEYSQAIDYLEAEVLHNSLYQESSQLCEAYYLSGSCYLEQEQYESAIEAFRKAILLDSSKAHYYRDYGIALARSGYLEQAREALIQASAKGLSDDSILLLRGEIAGLEKDYEGAVAYLQECLNTSADDYVKLSAALKLDSILKDGYGDAAYQDRINLLEAVMSEIGEEKRLPLKQRMVQVYGDYGHLTQDTQYTMKAVALLDEIISGGFATLVEWMDKGIYLQSMGDYTEAESCFLDALQKYPDQYLLYKRLAFLELDVQSAKATDSRTYQKFNEYYKTCTELYNKSNATEQDLEMPYLEQVYNELKVMGWLQ